MNIKPIMTGLIIAFGCFSTHAQLQTLVVSTTNTNSAVITVASNSCVTIKTASVYSSATLLVTMQGVNFTFNLSFQDINNFTFTGPATLQLQGDSYAPAFVTVDVEPGFFPPGKTATVGSYSGNVQVTMQMSTDLVNWTTATNGMTYTNSPDARFFRIQLITNAQGP